MLRRIRLDLGLGSLSVDLGFGLVTSSLGLSLSLGYVSLEFKSAAKCMQTSNKV